MSDTATLDAPTTTNAATNSAPPAPGGQPSAAAPADWRSTLPEDLRGAPSLAKFADPVALAKSYTELEGLVGRKGLIVPTDKDGPEVHARYRAALGVPEKPEAYAFTQPEGIPEQAWNADGLKAFSGWAHELGLTPQQAQGIAERFAAQQAAELQRQAEGIEPDGRTMEDVLRQEWGAAYDAKTELAKRAARQFGASTKILDALEAKVGGSELLRFFANLGERVAEDSPPGMTPGRGGALTPDEARAELAQIRGDMKGPYWNRMHPEHRIKVDRALQLEEMILAGQPAAR